MTDNFYRASKLKRARRTKSELRLLESQITEMLKNDHPQSIRYIFYRVTDPRLSVSVEKSDNGYRHVQDRCIKLRRSGLAPYSWIADMSRRGYFVNTYSDVGDFIRRMAGFYRTDRWTGADYRYEVWTESRSIASVIQKDCNDLAVDLFLCGGFSSLSFVHYTAQQLDHSSCEVRIELVELKELTVSVFTDTPQ